MGKDGKRNEREEQRFADREDKAQPANYVPDIVQMSYGRGTNKALVRRLLSFPPLFSQSFCLEDLAWLAP